MTTVAAERLTRSEEVAALLAEAGKATILILTCRQMRRFESPEDGLLDILGALTDQPASRDIIESSSEDLGHAPAWLDAGGVYEELLADRGSADFVFCLDPWAAQLLSRVNEAAPEARWILVSDLDRRNGEYWQNLERWFDSLPWSTIVPRDLWDEVVGKKKLPEPAALHAQKQGAWQLKPIAPLPPERAIVFLVRYSGSFPHLKVFLESLARQQYPKDKISCRIVAKEPTDDLQRYVRWHGLAHPLLRVDVIDDAPSPGDDFLLEMDDHAVLPDDFARRVGAGKELSVLRLNPEITAHILTGNLDPIAHYEKLAGGPALLHLGDLP